MSVSHAQLKAFHAVAVHGSFTKAAERLFLTQPAISDQVQLGMMISLDFPQR